MTLSQIYVIATVAIPLVLVMTKHMRIDVAALLSAAALGIAQALGAGVLGAPNTPRDAALAIDGFSQPVVITLLALFIVTRSLDKTGVTRWIARRILMIGGKSERRLIVLFTVVAVVLSLFMNNLAAGALLLPSAIDVTRRSGVRPSKLLMPIAYGTLLGGSATYFTTANIIASDLLTTANPPQMPLNFLDFTVTGGLIAIAGIIFVALFAQRLLPDREPKPEQAIARRTGSDLEEAYQLGERLWEVRVPSESPLVGKTLSQLQLGDRLGIAIAAIWHGRRALFAPSPARLLYGDDILLVVGREDRVKQLAASGFKVGRESNGHVSKRGVRFLEVVIAPHSSADGHSLKELEFRKQYGFTAVALLRDGQSYRTDVASMSLQVGDSLLVVGDQRGMKRLWSHPDYVVLEPDLSDQPVAAGQAALSVAITLGAVVASILGAPVFLAMLTAALLVFMLGLLSIEDAYRTMEWQAIFLIAGMYSVSVAMVNTGLADLIGQQVINLVSPFGGLGLVAGAYLLTGALTQVMGGQVTTLVTAPILISAAIQLQISPQAVAVASAIGCSASFITPIAHPVNILMIAPANYTFGDFFRFGWGLTIVSFIMLMLGMILFWHL